MAETYSIHVVPDETTEGSACYLAYHPELEGCMSHGTTVGEAIQELHAACELYLSALKELGEPIPSPSTNQTMVIWENYSYSPISPGVHTSVSSLLPISELTASR